MSNMKDFLDPPVVKDLANNLKLCWGNSSYICVIKISLCELSIIWQNHLKFYAKKNLENTTKNTLISPNFLLWKCWWKEQFLHSLGQIEVPSLQICSKINSLRCTERMSWDNSKTNISLHNNFTTPWILQLVGLIRYFQKSCDFKLDCDCENESRCKFTETNTRRYVRARKFYTRRSNKKVDSIETGRIAIGDLLPWSNLEKCM